MQRKAFTSKAIGALIWTEDLMCLQSSSADEAASVSPASPHAIMKATPQKQLCSKSQGV